MLLVAFSGARKLVPDLLYMNGFFEPNFTIFPQLLWRIGYWGNAKRLLAPRGEFSEGALARRRLKKRMYLAIYRALGLAHGVVWHASSDAEASDIRQLWGENATILVRENETSLPPLAERRHLIQASCDGPLKTVFLGRLVEHKGLHVALEALRTQSAEIELNIYGLEEDREYVARCRKLVATLPLNVRVRFHGPVEHEAVAATLEGCHLMLLPTASENFGHVIAEALSVGCPVMATSETPWTGRLESGGGIVLASRNPSLWEKAIREYSLLSSNLRLATRVAAADTFDGWKTDAPQPHIFELYRSFEHTSPRKNARSNYRSST
ncbi:glycosyltransferase [Paramicrobacterium fandaimingii]|uniref:glycosyltransferase n=1 Tax=Paramicrobacterium fandaimingii TaxID=2708079 RepID=UPI00141E7EF0|nr:glycosyltransferase [Microbacterium fandaimingii]